MITKPFNPQWILLEMLDGLILTRFVSTMDVLILEWFTLWYFFKKQYFSSLRHVIL